MNDSICSGCPLAASSSDAASEYLGDTGSGLQYSIDDPAVEAAPQCSRRSGSPATASSSGAAIDDVAGVGPATPGTQRHRRVRADGSPVPSELRSFSSIPAMSRLDGSPQRCPNPWASLSGFSTPGIPPWALAGLLARDVEGERPLGQQQSAIQHACRQRQHQATLHQQAQQEQHAVLALPVVELGASYDGGTMPATKRRRRFKQPESAITIRRDHIQDLHVDAANKRRRIAGKRRP